MMTLDDLATALAGFDPDAPLIFVTDAGEIGPGYHVTELTHASVTGIDCGGQITAWTEAALQIINGHGDTYLKAAKLAAILDHSLNSVEGLGSAPLRIQYAPDNAGLRLYELARARQAGGRAVLQLSPAHGLCKPMERAAQGVSAVLISGSRPRCCG